MTKKFCDRCGKELVKRSVFRKKSGVHDVLLNYELVHWGPGRHRFELCHECVLKLCDFLNLKDTFMQNIEVECDEGEK